MHSNGPSGRVTSSTGNVDLDGNILGQALLARLRTQVGADQAASFDREAHVRCVAGEVERCRRAEVRR